MSKLRETRSGKWELAVRHPSLPGGRKYLTFDSEEAAVEYGRGWKAMKMADLPPPAELMAPTVGSGVTFRRLLTDWEASGHSAVSQKSTITRLLDEVGKVRLVNADYKWLAA